MTIVYCTIKPQLSACRKKAENDLTNLPPLRILSACQWSPLSGRKTRVKKSTI